MPIRNPQWAWNYFDMTFWVKPGLILHSVIISRSWAFKHPTPWDFFHAMENGSGEDLSWFWRGWFMNNWKVDEAVSNVEYLQSNPANGALITIQNREKLPMPVTVEVKEMGGQTGRVNLPVEIWQRGGEWKFYYPSTRTN